MPWQWPRWPWHRTPSGRWFETFGDGSKKSWVTILGKIRAVLLRRLSKGHRKLESVSNLLRFHVLSVFDPLLDICCSRQK